MGKQDIDMDIIEEIRNKLLETKNKVKNDLVKNVIIRNIEGSDKYDEFKNSIEIYIDNINLLKSLDNLTLKMINKELKNFLNYTQSTNAINSNIVVILDSMNLLIAYTPKTSTENTLFEKLKDFKNNGIPKEEFSSRYDKLIQLLNTQDKVFNLVLETFTEQNSFKVYKNKDSLVILTGKETSPISISKDRLLKVAYKEKDCTYPSYEKVIIDKIFDNSIFDFINDNSEVSNTIDFSHMPEGRITKLEEERLKTVGQLKEIEDKLEKRENEFIKVSELLEKSLSLESDFNTAKESVLKDLKIEEPVKYWEKQVKAYSRMYWFYLFLVVVISIFLLNEVYSFLENSPLVINGIDSNTTVKNNINEVVGNVVNKFVVWKYGFLILATTMCIWLLKILVKIALSNYHLSVDAKERVIMIRTYLALLKEGSGYEIDDKKVILDNIFRPTNFGIIKDETSVTIADIVSSFKNK